MTDFYFNQSYGMNPVLICQGDVKNFLQTKDSFLQYIR